MSSVDNTIVPVPYLSAQTAAGHSHLVHMLDVPAIAQPVLPGDQWLHMPLAHASGGLGS